MRKSPIGTLLAILGGAFLPAVSATTSAVANDIQITTLSSRPDTVSGGDVLVRVDFPQWSAKVNVLLNGKSVTSAFQPVGIRGSIMGLVTGLRVGENTLTAQVGTGNGNGNANGQNNPGLTESLTITNYPITGPIISGPHERPFFCMTQTFNIPPGTADRPTLGPALDADCSVATRVDYVYVTSASSTPTFKPMLNTSTYPGDVAMTVTSEGKTVPYIVRVETGTIDRGIYQTAILHDPVKEKAPTPFAPPAAWNHRLVYTFGGGCVGGWYIQGRTLGNSGRIGVLEDLMLRQGYAVAANTLNVFGNNCQDLLAAESMMMTRERFIKNFGPAEFTIGYGCSGGSEAQHPISDEYPGLLDGIIVGCTFPEVIAAMVNNITDADLVYNYLHKNTKLTWTDSQILAATGYPTVTTLATIGPPNAVRVKAQGGTCNAIIPTSMIYDRNTNPTGIRCDLYDHLVNVLGRDPVTGFARRPLDNIGVQYGLQALNAGTLDKQHFLDLNQNIGGYDNDGNYVPTRTVGDVKAIKAAYSSGRVTYGGLGMRQTPIIDYRGYVDQPENGNEVHSRFHSFSMRQRLIDVNGNADNQVMLVESGFGPAGLFGDNSPVLSHSLTQMDQWLTNIKADNTGMPLERKIARDKPSDLTDACFTNDGTVKIAEKQVYQGNTTCNQLYPAFSTPRMVAGEPLENNVLKCHLKPLNPGDYRVTFTAAEWNQLQTLFPGGVCDYNQPGVGQEPTEGIWQFFPQNQEQAANN
jgi:hypothetical protein